MIPLGDSVQAIYDCRLANDGSNRRLVTVSFRLAPSFISESDKCSVKNRNLSIRTSDSELDGEFDIFVPRGLPESSRSDMRLRVCDSVSTKQRFNPLN